VQLIDTKAPLLQLLSAKTLAGFSENGNKKKFTRKNYKKKKMTFDHIYFLTLFYLPIARLRKELVEMGDFMGSVLRLLKMMALAPTNSTTDQIIFFSLKVLTNVSITVGQCELVRIMGKNKIAQKFFKLNQLIAGGIEYAFKYLNHPWEEIKIQSLSLISNLIESGPYAKKI
jgi:hypothetical protein